MHNTKKKRQLCNYIVHLDNHTFEEVYKMILGKKKLSDTYTTDDFNEQTLQAIAEMADNRKTKQRYSNADEIITNILGTRRQNV